MSGINAFFWVAAVVIAALAITFIGENLKDWYKALLYARSEETRRWLESRASLDKASGVWRIEVPFDADRWRPDFRFDLNSAVRTADKENA